MRDLNKIDHRVMWIRKPNACGLEVAMQIIDKHMEKREEK